MKNKNLWLLPTDKPSRLHLRNGKLILHLHRLQYTQISQHIYITSDSDLDINDWVTDGKNIWQVSYILADNIQQAKKIILTTDVDLIKDGVQAIDDEFLEWICKNPSCEEVEVENVYKKFLNGDKRSVSDFRNKYKIIIPKEEAKQETLEEAAREYGMDTYPSIKLEDYTHIMKLNYAKLATAFKYGAKWQQEQLYSEEEVINLLKALQLYKLVHTERIDIEKWLEKFKNK